MNRRTRIGPGPENETTDEAKTDMQAHKIQVVIPEDHHLVVPIPEAVRSGPAELILLVPSAGAAKETREAEPEGRGRLKRLAEELAQDPRPFKELSLEERRARLRKVMGAGRGLLSSSDEFARQKIQEIELEERKFARRS